MKIIVLHGDGHRQEITADQGLSVMESLRKADLLAGGCNGSLACATCHVWINPDWLSKLPPPSPSEEDMLDVAFHLQPTSRLSCQIGMSPDLDGIVVQLPAAT